MAYAKSEIGRLCYKNNVYDFDIKANEDQLVKNLELFGTDTLIDTASDVMEAVNAIFFRKIEITSENIRRMTNGSARKFYAMILDWRASSTSYKEMIANFVGYWRNLKDKVVYFGKAWGEVARDDDQFIPTYIDINGKSNTERINLAIIKIKEEQDFVEYNLLKYIDILNDLELLDAQFYDEIKYGSSDGDVISLLKNGFSIELAKALIERYRSLISINNQTDEISINPDIIEEMTDADENKILLFEINYHIRLNR